MKKKVIALVLVCVLVFGIAVGGTLAWLADKTQSVVNTFTTSDVSITLTEEGAVDNKQEFKMVPGITINKAADVSVVAGSEDCWLFVKVDKSTNYDTFMDPYAMATGWNQLEDGEGNSVEGVYYREAKAGDSFGVLANDQVIVRSDVTVDVMETVNESNKPTLTFTAYGVQKANVTNASDAWEIAEALS